MGIENQLQRFGTTKAVKSARILGHTDFCTQGFSLEKYPDPLVLRLLSGKLQGAGTFNPRPSKQGACVRPYQRSAGAPKLRCRRRPAPAARAAWPDRRAR